MRILYLSGSYVPSRRASAVHVMKMCQALAARGHQVELVSKRSRSRMEAGVVDDHAFYGVRPCFDVHKLSRPAIRGGGTLFSLGLRRLLRRTAPRADLAYCRDPTGAGLALGLGLPVVYEAHGPPHGGAAHRRFAALIGHPGLRRLVVISEALRAELERLELLPAGDKTLVAPDGADAAPPGDARSLPGDGPHLGYVGHLYDGKGMVLLTELARRLPEVHLHVIGGTKADLASWRRRGLPESLHLHGFVPPGAVGARLASFDVLLLPPGRRVTGAARRYDIAAWMSPLKMFEYMAAEKPIVASDLPVLREVLRDGHNALLAPPDDASAWAAAVRRLLADPELAGRLASRARRDLETHYTWDQRARRVLADLDLGPVAAGSG